MVAGEFLWSQVIPTGCVIPDEGLQGSCILKEHKNVGVQLRTFVDCRQRIIVRFLKILSMSQVPQL